MRRSLGVAAGVAVAVAFVATLVAVLTGPDDVVDAPTRHVGSAGVVAVMTNPNVLSRVGPVLHLTARRTRPADTDLLLAVAHTEDVRSYLGDAPHEVVVQVLPEIGRVRSSTAGGPGTLPGKPAGQDFWVLTGSGRDAATVRWASVDGVWSWAVLNADGSPGVDVDVTVGVEVPGLFGWSLAVLGADVAATLGVAGWLLWGRRWLGARGRPGRTLGDPARRRSRPSRSASSTPAPPGHHAPVDVG
jgi:hypothetical protein